MAQETCGYPVTGRPMEPVPVLVGCFLIAVAGYAASDPMARSRNWVSGREWETNPAAAKRKQVLYTYAISLLLGSLGAAVVVAGLVLG